MAASEPTIVIGKLDDKELQASIEKLVSDVADKSQEMAGKFESAMDKMKSSMKDFAITQKVSVDLMKEAWRDMSKSFDAMMKAQESAKGKGTEPTDPIDPNTVRGLEKQIAQEVTKRKGMYLDSDELLEQNDLIAKLKQERKEQLMTEKELDEYYEKQNKKLEKQSAEQLKNSQKPLLKVFEETKTRPVKTLDEYEQKLHDLQRVQQSMRASGLFDQTQLNKNQQVIDNLEKKINEIRNKKPKSLDDVLGMDESSVDAITKKMQALKLVRIDPSDANQVKALSSKYQELAGKKRQYLGQNKLIENSNLSLARSFGYIRNRLVYAFTIGAVLNFTKELIRVRAEYEMLDRSLGILIGDMEKGTQIFNELNEMALKSPFTLIELGTAAKQLTAYNFAANEVVDTTRRLADISAALGVPMERLTYNLGQIKAQGVLNARDARDFANAGLAIVPMLAKLYTEQKRFGDEIVTTAQVYDMMSKKMVSYGDVLHVLTDITDEGGKFFDFQAKQADTLKVQLANLTLAWNNMLNEIGTDNQGILSGTLGMIRTLVQNWKTVRNTILTVVTALGTYRAITTIINALNSRMFMGSLLVNLRNYVNGIKAATGAMAKFNAVTRMNPLGLLVSVLATAGVAFLTFGNNVEEASEDVEMFGENSAKTLGRIRTIQKILAGLDENTATYKSAMQELNGILNEYGITEISNREEINEKIKQTIALIEEEASARQYANQMAKGEEEYNKKIKEANDEFYKGLQDISFTSDAGSYVSDKIKKNLEQNASAISDVVGQVIESNIGKVVGKTGQEAENGIQEINKEITRAMRNMGFSDAEIGVLLNLTNLVREQIEAKKEAAEAQGEYNQRITDYYTKGQKLSKGVLSFNQKLEAQKKVMKQASTDAKTLYDRIYSIVDLAKKNSKNTITFDLQLTATNPPKWMKNFSDEKIRELATNFGAIAAAGGRAKGMTREQTLRRSLEYASEYRLREEAKASERDTNKTAKTRTKQTDEFAKAIKEVGNAMTNTRKKQQELLKEGIDGTTILNSISENYGKTIELNNKKLQSFGVKGLKTASDFANMGQREQKGYLLSLLDVAKLRGSAEAIEYLEGKLADLNEEILKTDNKTLVDSLKSGLDQLKDEYEIGLELDANPELGGIIAQSFGLTDEQMQSIPRTAKQVAERIQKVFDEKLGKGTLNFLDFTDKKAFESAMGMLGILPKSGKAEVLDAYRQLYNKILKDETKAQTDEWNKLIERYGGLQAQILKIYKDSVKEQIDIVREFGDDEQVIDALDLSRQINLSQDPAEIARLQQQLANILNDVTSGKPIALKTYQATQKQQKTQISKAYWEDFKDSDLYAMTFEDTANLSNRAIDTMIDKLEQLKDKVKESPNDLKALINAKNELEKTKNERNPFGAIVDGINEWVNASKKVDQAKEKLVLANQDVAIAEKQLAQAEKNGLSDDILRKQEKLNKAKEAQEQATIDVTNAENKQKKASTKVRQGMENLANTLNSVKGVFDSVSQTFRAFGDDETADAIDEIGKGFTMLVPAIMSVAVAMKTLESSSVWLLAISTAVSVLMGLISFLSGAKDKKITEQVEDSERAVKRLELAYIDLEHAVNEAYGMAAIGANMAAKANKELQLAELKRQLALERSRDSKHKDEDKIIDLQKQIRELEYDIEDASNNIINDLLGISSVGDAMENMMDAFIEALRSGEDAMATFDESVDEMIANMVKKMFTTKILQPWFEEQWGKIQKQVEQRAGEVPNELAKVQARVANAKGADMNNDSSLVNALRALGWSDAQIDKLIHPDSQKLIYTDDEMRERTQRLREAYKKAFDEATQKEAELQKQLTTVTMPTTDDIRQYAELLRSGQPILEENMQEVANFLRELGLMKDDADKNLSALQQGIQGITEETAGAIESYLNGVSQQCYLQSDLLTQIRDAVVAIDSDVQTSTQAEMLLQLQQSYQVQMSIESILQGVLVPSGRAFAVEIQ